MSTERPNTPSYFAINRARWKLATALGVTLLFGATTVSAMNTTAQPVPDLLEIPEQKPFSADNSIWLGSFRSLTGWKPVAADEVVLWSSPKRAYLVKIWRPHRNLRHSQQLGVTRTAGRVTRFDSVLVDGWRYPIRSIERIDAGVARTLKYRPQRTRGS